MTATILEAAGFDPTVAVGGLRPETGTNFRCGQSAWFLTEADESDGSFLALRPELAVVLNLENDHITSDEAEIIDRVWEEYKNFEAFQLSALTHADNSPWHKTYADGAGRSRVISDDQIWDHFADLAARHG